MKKTKITLILIILFLLTIFFVSKVIKWNKDNNIIENETKEILDNITINEIDNIKENNQIDKSNIYTDYAKMKLIDVDFNNLIEINKNVKGWIQVKGTNINYPYVQYKDNDYYLTHSFEDKKNDAGWIFMDYRNKVDDTNTIIYGHNRFNKTMFGSLKDTTKKKWFNNKDNHYIKISDFNNNYLYEIFSIYKIATTSDYLITNFNNVIEYTIFLRNLVNRSIFDFNNNPDIKDKILTLSTCNGSKEKLVVHAKLISKQRKDDNNE